MQGWDEEFGQPENEDEYEHEHDEYEYEDEHEEQQYEATFEQQIHSSEQNDCGIVIVKEPGKEDEYRKAISQLDPVDRLKQLIGSIVYSLNDNNIIEISSKERNEICRSVNNLRNVNTRANYVNPLAYVLGYVAYHKNLMITDTDSTSEKNHKVSTLKKEIFDKLDTININNVKNYAVFPPDVVRYMILWSRIN